MFRWVVDEDGWIGVEIARIVTLTKYKDGTIVRWFARLPRADKWKGE